MAYMECLGMRLSCANCKNIVVESRDVDRWIQMAQNNGILEAPI